MDNICPYCLQRPLTSDEHIFSQFLGGKKTIRSCTQCNNDFGRLFEGSVSKDLAPIIVFLSFSGYKHKRLVVYEHAWVDETTGIEYDIDSEHKSYPNKPHLIKDQEGKLNKIVARSQSEARKIAVSLKSQGKIQEFRQKEGVREGIQPPLKNIRLTIGTEIRQMAVKMCIALGQLIVPNTLQIDQSCRSFLLSHNPTISPVRQVFFRYPELDIIRPPLAHVIYIEGNPDLSQCFGVVQFFGGAFQFYVPLSYSYTGRKFAAIGTLDIVTFQEEFKEIDPLQLSEAPEWGNLDIYSHFSDRWAENFNTQIQVAFGQTGIVFGMSQKQQVSGININLPLVWLEYTPTVQVQILLTPDYEPGKDLNMVTDPNQWIFSPDYGKTDIKIFETFGQKWNDNLLNQTIGYQHTYIPDDLISGTRLLIGEDFWCPVSSLIILYTVQKAGWIGSVKLSNLAGEYDSHEKITQVNFTLTQDDIPTSRDPSWQPLTDPDNYIANVEDVLIIEQRGIDIKNLHFTEFYI